MDQNKRSTENGSVSLDISIFAPQTSSLETKVSSTEGSSPESKQGGVRAPEKSLTLFALRLAILEKSASSIGTLGFIWATVVLLGGFAITLAKTDFWFVTVILVIEGTRIFGRSHELEWQHQSTWSITDMGISSFRAIKSSSNFIISKMKTVFSSGGNASSKAISMAEKESRKPKLGEKKAPCRTWTTSDVPIFPWVQWIFVSKNISKFLYWLQLASAATCVVLSMLKLVRRDFGEIAKGDSDKRNRQSALIIFYSLALADAVLFLLEKAYWEWKFRVENLLEKVNEECELGESDLVSTRRFFYDSYSKCVNSSIFDGLKMDMVSFAMELLESNSMDEQLIGARILRKFSAQTSKFSKDTLQKIGVNLSAIARLLEILDWKDEEQEELRHSAAEIITNLAKNKQNPLRIAEIPGAMESISSLLHSCRSNTGASYEISEKQIIFDDGNYSPWSFNHLGLEILRKLARDHDICGKIGNTRGLLTKIIDFMHTEEELLQQPTVAMSQIVTVKRSLQLLQRLANTSGVVGMQLRKDISDKVFTVSYIRDILKHGERHPELQLLGIRILSSLATAEEATDQIGGTGGMLKALFGIFFNWNAPENQNKVREAAGEALATLALQSTITCHRIMKLHQNGKLIRALNDRLLRVNAARILRNMCCYSGNDSFWYVKELTAAARIILDAIMNEESQVQEVMIGAAAPLFRLMDEQESTALFRKAGIMKHDLVRRLSSTLKQYRQPSIKVPGIRRYTVELAIWMMKDDSANITTFWSLQFATDLESVLDTTSELESFNIFSGTVGMYRHKTEMYTLIEMAMELLQQEEAKMESIHG